MPDNIKLNGKLECLVSSLNGELSGVFDTLAPLKECKVNLRAKQPWYDQQMKVLKRKVHKYEKKWLKYKLDPLWVAFKKVRNSYYGLLNIKKRTTLQDKIQECTKDSQRLHKLVSNPTFFSKGLTTAVFHSLQKAPSPSDLLTILVIRGRIFGTITLSIVVGIGSSSQDLDLRPEMTLLTSSWDNGANSFSSGTTKSSGE